MSTITLDEQLTKFDKISNNNINSITFKDIISMIFYAIQNMTHNFNPDEKKWNSFYQDFINDLEKQNKNKWPKLTIIRNDYQKRMDIMSSVSEHSYIKSNNFLVLLLRLLYIENYKRIYTFKWYKYHKILGYNIVIDRVKEIQKLTIADLFDLLKIGLKYYLKIYDNELQFEYQLATSILEQIE